MNKALAANHTRNWNGLRSWNCVVVEAKITVHPGRGSTCGPLGGTGAQSKQYPAHIKAPPPIPSRQDFGSW
jgi:hypothetical protein